MGQASPARHPGRLGSRREFSHTIEPNCDSRMAGAGSGTSPMLNGHLDTNPAGEGWTKDPFGGDVDDECIYGIGVSNMKAADAAYVAGLQAVQRAGIRLRGDVILAHVV